MRYEHDHPRTWDEIRATLPAADVEQFIAYAARYEITDLQAATPQEVEALYTLWRRESVRARSHS